LGQPHALQVREVIELVGDETIMFVGFVKGSGRGWGSGRARKIAGEKTR